MITKEFFLPHCWEASSKTCSALCFHPDHFFFHYTTINSHIDWLPAVFVSFHWLRTNPRHWMQEFYEYSIFRSLSLAFLVSGCSLRTVEMETHGCVLCLLAMPSDFIFYRVKGSSICILKNTTILALHFKMAVASWSCNKNNIKYAWLLYYTIFVCFENSFITFKIISYNTLKLGFI